MVLEEYIHSNPPVKKNKIKNNIKGWNIIGFRRVHPFQSSSFQEIYERGSVHHWF